MDPILGLAGALLTLLGVIASAWFTSKVSNRKLKSDAGHQMIDQLQEEMVSMRREIIELRKTQRIQGDYIGQLRRHIAEQHPPPPPPFPNGLVA